MDFGASVKHGFRRYVGFRGRAQRSEFWWFLAFLVLGEAGLAIATNFLATVASVAGLPRRGGVAEAIVLVSGVAQMVFVLALVLPLLAVIVRRFHDVGLSGWWLAPATAVAAFGAFQDPQGPAAGAALPLMLLGFAAIGLVACLRGARGANRYGPDRAEPISEVFGGEDGSAFGRG